MGRARSRPNITHRRGPSKNNSAKMLGVRYEFESSYTTFLTSYCYITGVHGTRAAHWVMLCPFFREELCGECIVAKRRCHFVLSQKSDLIEGSWKYSVWSMPFGSACYKQGSTISNTMRSWAWDYRRGCWTWKTHGPSHGAKVVPVPVVSNS